MNFSKSHVLTLTLVLLVAFALPSLGQTSNVSDPFPTFPLPSGLVATGNFDQLGDPQFTASIGGVYPIAGSIGLYGISGAEFYPQRATDPKTGKQFYAIRTNLQQEVHKELFRKDRLSFLIGIQAGPSFSSTPAEGFNVAFAGGGSLTAVYQITKMFSLLMSPKVMYVSGINVWNVIPRLGIKINLK